MKRTEIFEFHCNGRGYSSWPLESLKRELKWHKLQLTKFQPNDVMKSHKHEIETLETLITEKE